MQFLIFFFFVIVLCSMSQIILNFNYQTIFFIVYSISFSNIHYYLNKSLSINFDKRRREIGSCFLITFYSSAFLYIILCIILVFLKIDQDLKNLILILNLILLSEPFSIFYSELFVRGQFKKIFQIKFTQNIVFLIFKLYIYLIN